MAAKRFSIMLDGEFVARRLGARLGREITSRDIESEYNRLCHRPDVANHEAESIYYYGAAPELAETLLSHTSIGFKLRDPLPGPVRTQLEASLRQAVFDASGYGLTRAGAARNYLESRLGLDMARLAAQGAVQAIIVATDKVLPALAFVREQKVKVVVDRLIPKPVGSVRQLNEAI